jgi:hypothetical protein
MAVHASEASTYLDEPGGKVILLKKRGRNPSQFRHILNSLLPPLVILISLLELKGRMREDTNAE